MPKVFWDGATSEKTTEEPRVLWHRALQAKNTKSKQCLVLPITKKSHFFYKFFRVFSSLQVFLRNPTLDLGSLLQVLSSTPPSRHLNVCVTTTLMYFGAITPQQPLFSLGSPCHPVCVTFPLKFLKTSLKRRNYSASPSTAPMGCQQAQANKSPCENRHHPN